MFEGPRLKIKRANQHVSELEKAINAFVKSDFCRVGIEEHGNTGNYILQFQMTRDPPCELPLIIGDALHNLRSALDIAYCEILVRVGAAPTDYSRFQFAEVRDELVSRLSDGPMKAAPDIIALIADVIKPYKAANDPLYALHRLDLTDKHILLIPTFNVATLRGVDAIDPVGHNTFDNLSFSVGPGGVLNAIGISAPLKITNQGQPTFSVSFGKDQALEGQPVIPTLHQLSQVVGGVLEVFEHALATRDAKPGV